MPYRLRPCLRLRRLDPPRPNSFEKKLRGFSGAGADTAAGGGTGADTGADTGVGGGTGADTGVETGTGAGTDSETGLGAFCFLVNVLLAEFLIADPRLLADEPKNCPVDTIPVPALLAVDPKNWPLATKPDFIP